MKTTLLLLIVLHAATFCCHAQSETHALQTDGAGKIITGLPELVFIKDNMNLKVSDPKESFEIYKKMLSDRVKKSKLQLEKLINDKDKMAILLQVYNIKSSDVTNVIGELDAVIKDQLVTGNTYVPVYVSGDEKYYSLDALATSVPFGPNVMSGDIQITAPANGGKLGFTLTKTQPFKKLAYNWLETTKLDYLGNFDPQEFKALRKLLLDHINSVTTYLSSIESFIAKSPHYVAGDLVKLTEIHQITAGYISTLNKFIETQLNATNLSAKYRDWILKWLWFQSAYMPSLNPFNFKAEGNLISEPDTSKLDALRYQIQAREVFYKSIDLENNSPEELDRIINETIKLRQEKTTIEKEVKTFLAAKSNNEQAILDFGNTANLLNEGMIEISKDKSSTFYWQRHHDASHNYQLLNKTIKDEYREDDQVVIISHNLKANERAKINLSFKDISNDASQLTDELSPLIKILSDAANTLAPKPAILDAVPSVVETERIKVQGRIAELIGVIENLKNFDKVLQYLEQQSNPVLEIKETVDKTLSYHSELSNPPKKMFGPKKATYYLNTTKTGSEDKKDESVPDTFTYRINKFYRIFPMAGAFYTTNKFVEMKDGKVDELSHTKFVVGLKVYFRRTDIRNTKFVLEKDEHNRLLLSSRLNLQAAFDVQKPLRNIYLGLGVDLWPGFCLSTGAVANKYTFTEYQNTNIVRTKNLYRGGFYFGLSTDISLFADALKFLNLSK